MKVRQGSCPAGDTAALSKPMTLHSSERRYTGRVINLDVDTVGFPDGSTGQLEMVRHPGAAAVVPLLDDLHAPDPRVLLLRQFRHAADGVIWEIPAGRKDAGETPLACAHRELEEETGMRAGRMEFLTSFFTTPGFTDERIHLYLASELTAGQHAREGDEFIELVPTPWSALRRLIAGGEIVDGKTLVALLYVDAFRAIGRGA